MISIKYSFPVKRPLFTLLMALLASGCTVQNSAKSVTSMERIQTLNAKKELDEHMQEWQEIKPQLQRLIALEQDLKVLVDGLAHDDGLFDNPLEPLLPSAENLHQEPLFASEQPVQEKSVTQPEPISDFDYFSDNTTASETVQLDSLPSVVQPTEVVTLNTPKAVHFQGAVLTEDEEFEIVDGIRIRRKQSVVKFKK